MAEIIEKNVAFARSVCRLPSKITGIAEKENIRLAMRNGRESVSKVNHFKKEQENILQNCAVKSLKQIHHWKHAQYIQEKETNS